MLPESCFELLLQGDAQANAEFQAGVPTGAYRSVVDSVAGGSVATDLRIYGRVRLGDLGSALDR